MSADRALHGNLYGKEVYGLQKRVRQQAIAVPAESRTGLLITPRSALRQCPLFFMPNSPVFNRFVPGNGFPLKPGFLPVALSSLNTRTNVAFR